MCSICKLKVGDKVKWSLINILKGDLTWLHYYNGITTYTIESIQHGAGWSNDELEEQDHNKIKLGCFVMFKEHDGKQGWDSRELIKISSKKLKVNLP